MKRILSVFALIALVAALFYGCASSGTLTDITLSANELELRVGDSANLSVSAVPNTVPAANLSWRSDNENIATVTDGTVKAVAEGSAVVSVTTENGITKSCNVKVSPKAVSSLSLDHTDAKIKVGKSIQLTATVSPEDAKANLVWSSSDDSIALVNSDGKVQGVKAGTVNITCKASDEIQASCTVVVTGGSSSSKASSSSGNTVINNYYYGGHLNQSYSATDSDFVFPYSSVEKLSDAQISATLSSMSGSPIADSFAQDAINEIYARNGYVFKTDYLRYYYESKPWYWKNSGFSTDDFNEIERYNINKLTKYS